MHDCRRVDALRRLLWWLAAAAQLGGRHASDGAVGPLAGRARGRSRREARRVSASSCARLHRKPVGARTGARDGARALSVSDAAARLEETNTCIFILLSTVCLVFSQSRTFTQPTGVHRRQSSPLMSAHPLAADAAGEAAQTAPCVVKAGSKSRTPVLRYVARCVLRLLDPLAAHAASMQPACPATRLVKVAPTTVFTARRLCDRRWRGQVCWSSCI